MPAGDTAIRSKEADGMNADGDNGNNTVRPGSHYRDRNPGSALRPASQAAPGRDTTAENTQPDPQQPPAPKRRAAARTAGSGGVLPNKAAEDDPRRWGDQAGSYDHDAWLQEQKPPHWG
jgi:cell division protein FtsN